MADWNGFKKNGTTYIPNDATARAGVIANTKLIKDTVGWTNKNVYPILLSELKTMWTNGTWSGNVYTDGTFTMTCNTSDGVHVSSVTFNGTFSRNVVLPFTQLSAGITQKNVPKTGKYILNGVTGGSASTYGFILNYFPTYGGTEAGLATLYDGESADLTINSEWWLKLYLQIKIGTYSNVTVYPMLRDANILDSTFEPYRNTTAFPRDEQAVLGAKQLLPITLSKLKELNTGGTWADNVYTFKGLIFTIAHDGDSVISITQTGTSTGSGYLYLAYLPLKNGDSFILNGSDSNSTSAGTSTYLRVGKGGTEGTFVLSSIGGAETPLNISEDNNYSFNIACGSSGITGTYVYKPMLRLASDPDSTYAPFAMTNKELTDAVTPIRDASGITLAENVVANDASEFNIFKIGQLVVLSLVIKGIVANAGTWFEVASLNEGYKVAYNFVGNAAKNNNKDAFDCLLQQDNKIRIRNIENAIVATDIIKITAVYISK